MRGEVAHQRRAIGRAAFGVAERIDLQHHVGGEPEFAQDVPAARNHLGIGEGFRGSDQFDPDLVELPVAALLRSLVAEHRAGVENLLRQRLRQPVGDQSAADRGRRFGPQGDAVAATIGEGVHLLGHDIRGLAEGAGEDRRLLEDRRRPFLETVEVRDMPGPVDDVAMAAHVFADEIAGSADRLEAGHVSIGLVIDRDDLADRRAERASLFRYGSQTTKDEQFWFFFQKEPKRRSRYSAATASAGTAASRNIAARFSTISTTWSIMASLSIVWSWRPAL